MSGRDPGDPGNPDDLLAEALEDLGREIRERFERRAGEREATAEVDVFAILAELRARTRTLGMRERRSEIDDFGMDPEWIERLRPLLSLLASRWFRVRSRGLGEVPDGPLLFVANRTPLHPWDGLLLAHLVAAARGESARPRPLLPDSLIGMPFAQPSLTRLGAVRACRENAERLLGSGRSVVAFPESAKRGDDDPAGGRRGPRIQRLGRGGAVRLGLELSVPLVPVAVVGGEELGPLLRRLPPLLRASGLPGVPGVAALPWLGSPGLAPRPSPLEIVFGEPLDVDDVDRDDQIVVSRLNGELRDRIQAMVDAGTGGGEARD